MIICLCYVIIPLLLCFSASRDEVKGYYDMKHSLRFVSAAAAVIFTFSGCAGNRNAQVTEPPSLEAPADTSAPSSSSDTASAAAATDADTSSADNEVQQESASATDNTGVSSETSESNSGTTAGTPTETSSGTTAGTSAGTAVAPNKPASGLSQNSGVYEGREGTGKYNYGEALQKSIMFYDLQRSGDLPDGFRCNWRGDSCLKDGNDNGIDLSGGFYDAGDNVKFNLPMSYSTALLAWSVVEDKASYKESGQLSYILDNIRWGNEYFIKCHPQDNVYYYQVGDGNADHGWWGPCEVVDVQMKRPSYKVDLEHPGSTVAGGTAASLALSAIVFADTDKMFSAECLKHAKSLYAYAEKVQSDSGYTAANGFYQSYGGFKDELAFAAYWLYKATGDTGYLNKAKTYYGDGDYKWALCWDDKSWGTALLLAKETGDAKYKNALEKHLDYWVNEIRKTPKGLAYLDQWAPIRYATTTAFVALSYAESSVCPADKAKKYKEFAETQVNYALGSSGTSYLIGFGSNYPKNPHHRTAHGSYTNNIGDPSNTRHILYGALIGGPDANDNYNDERANYQNTEVACDYNAGFTGALVKLYKQYGGKTLKNFGAIETPDDELYADATVNVNGQDFVEIKALVYNKTAFPARNTNNLKLCYFFDISEIVNAGGSAADLVVSTNYMQGGKASDVLCWNKEKNLYYVAIDFTGVDIYPGGQDSYKKEVQFRIRNTKGVWDSTNDPSFIDVGQVSMGTLTKANNMALYEGTKLVFGTEPNDKNTGDAIKDIKPSANSGNSGNSGNNGNNGNSGNNGGGYTGSGTVNNDPAVQESTRGDLKLSLEQQQASGKGNTIAFTIKITNNGSSAVDLSKLSMDYFFTNDGGGNLVFECDYADIQGSAYQAMKESISGSFSKASGDKTDTKCTVKSSGTLAVGDTLTINIRIHKSDWSEMDLGNDLSGANADKVNVIYNGKKL